jgi:hypothetical protein
MNARTRLIIFFTAITSKQEQIAGNTVIFLDEDPAEITKWSTVETFFNTFKEQVAIKGVIIAQILPTNILRLSQDVPPETLLSPTPHNQRRQTTPVNLIH